MRRCPTWPYAQGSPDAPCFYRRVLQPSRAKQRRGLKGGTTTQGQGSIVAKGTVARQCTQSRVRGERRVGPKHRPRLLLAAGLSLRQKPPPRPAPHHDDVRRKARRQTTDRVQSGHGSLCHQKSQQQSTRCHFPSEPAKAVASPSPLFSPSPCMLWQPCIGRLCLGPVRHAISYRLLILSAAHRRYTVRPSSTSAAIAVSTRRFSSNVVGKEYHCGIPPG